ncbi:MAG: hypothetical protein ACRDIB_02590, partial [Ardenticatenaceae bacterium]
RQSRSFERLDRGLMSGFTGLMDLQLLLGVVLIIGAGDITRERLEHTLLMVIAVAASHLPAFWRDANDSTRFRNNALTIIGVLLLIIAGIAALPGNRWTIAR